MPILLAACWRVLLVLSLVLAPLAPLRAVAAEPAASPCAAMMATAAATDHATMPMPCCPDGKGCAPDHCRLAACGALALGVLPGPPALLHAPAVVAPRDHRMDLAPPSAASDPPTRPPIA